MIKVKTFKLFPLFVLPSVVLAETAEVVPAQAQVVTQVPQVAVNQTVPAADNVLPQLSLEAQKAREAELEQQRLYNEQARLEAERKTQELNQAESRVRQEVGNNQLMLSRDVAGLYLENNFAPMWQNKQAEKAFLKEYAVFAASGVSGKAASALQQIINSQTDSLARDMLLTDSLLDFLYYTGNVSRSANEWLYQLGSYRTQSPSEAQKQRWLSAVRGGSTAQFVSNLVPRNHIYQDTVAKLFGSAPSASEASTEATNTKGKKSKTKKSAKSSAGMSAATFAKLALNAQRLRIIPSFNNGIFVNIPSYQLYYFRDGQLVLQSKVIVGKDERRTPVMSSKLSNVVVNPPWNIPPTILSKDFIPKMARDPGYAERGGFEVLDAKGNKVNPRGINWGSYVGSKNFPYRIRQKAGDDSALGRFKFNMPSSNAIYLHDTPNRNLFNKTERALSSGCVRVAKADELATILLKEAGWSEERKQKVLQSEKTTSAQIRSDNPVYLYYVTAWVENGKIYTLPDIYKLDSQVKKTSLNWAAVKNSI